MKIKPFILGLCAGLILGAGMVLYFSGSKEEPALLQISGVLEVNSATSQDGLLDNRVYLREPVQWKGPLYLSSDKNKGNDLYSFIGKAVNVSGRVRMIKGSSSVPELLVEKISSSKSEAAKKDPAAGH